MPKAKRKKIPRISLLKKLKEKIVVLHSGGFDSVVLTEELYKMRNYKSIYLLHFLYGALNEEEQLEKVKKQAKRLNLNLRVIRLPAFDWTKSEFFNPDINEYETQYLEYRNLIFLAYAISYAESLSAKKVAMAVLGNAEFKDTTESFFDGLNSFTYPNSNIWIWTPFADKDKDYLIHLAKYLNITKEDFFSCDTPKNHNPCGECEDCKILKDILTKS